MKALLLEAAPRPRVLHVWFPALEWKRKGEPEFPAWALRETLKSNRFRLFSRIEIDGPSSLVFNSENPLSGTGGRATCLVHTSAPLVCFFDPKFGHYSYSATLKTAEEICAAVLEGKPC